MLIIKFYRRPNRPEFAHLVQVCAIPGHSLHGFWLINHPVWKPYARREAEWIDPNDVYVDWVREFRDPE